MPYIPYLPLFKFINIIDKLPKTIPWYFKVGGCAFGTSVQDIQHATGDKWNIVVLERCEESISSDTVVSSLQKLCLVYPYACVVYNTDATGIDKMFIANYINTYPHIMYGSTNPEEKTDLHKSDFFLYEGMFLTIEWTDYVNEIEDFVLKNKASFEELSKPMELHQMGGCWHLQHEIEYSYPALLTEAANVLTERIEERPHLRLIIWSGHYKDYDTSFMTPIAGHQERLQLTKENMELKEMVKKYDGLLNKAVSNLETSKIETREALEEIKSLKTRPPQYQIIQDYMPLRVNEVTQAP